MRSQVSSMHVSYVWLCLCISCLTVQLVDSAHAMAASLGQGISTLYCVSLCMSHLCISLLSLRFMRVIVQLGDSAHAMAASLGQGISAALKDVECLAEL